MRLVLANAEQQVSRDAVTYSAWGSPLTLEDYLQRENRLYQADWLLRHYGFAVDEIAATAEEGMLDLEVDPKLAWALKNRERFPVDVNVAPRELLLRVPGLGKRAVDKLVAAINEVKEKIGLCSTCNNITDVDPCRYCSNPNRDHSTILVVEEPFNLITVEKTREYRGVYHVLHGALSPIRGIGPDELKIRNLFERMRTQEVREIILATNPNTEGEATANYLGKLLRPLGVKITRIAMGVPVGSDLEYADEVTMHKSLVNRHEL